MKSIKKVKIRVSPILSRMEATFNKTSLMSDDVFEGIYSNLTVNIIMVFLYFTGLAFCFGIALIIWFEKSGQAGPYRTLINQLVSCRLQNTILIYLMGFTIPIIRIITGPLPMSVCYLTSFGTIFPGIKAALLGLVTSAFRFAFVFRYKKIPPMNDYILMPLFIGLWWSGHFLLALSNCSLSPKRMLDD